MWMFEIMSLQFSCYIDKQLRGDTDIAGELTCTELLSVCSC